MGLWDETKILHSLYSSGLALSPNSWMGTLQRDHKMPFSHQLAFSHNFSLKLVIILKHTGKTNTHIHKPFVTHS